MPKLNILSRNLLMAVLIFASFSFVISCSRKLIYDPIEHSPFLKNGQADLVVFADISESKGPMQVSLYPATAYFEGSVGISEGYDDYSIDPRYADFVQEKPLTDAKAVFTSIPSGDYYVIAWFTKKEKIPNLPSARGTGIETHELAGLIGPGGLTINGRKFTQSDIVWEDVLKNYGIGKKVTIPQSGHTNVELSENMPNSSIWPPYNAFLRKQRKIDKLKVIK